MEQQSLELNPWQRWAGRFAAACVALTLFLIAVGAVVTTTRAGDTNPDWSFRFWEWISTWMNSSGGRAWEDGHRVVGTLVGFCGIGLALTMWKGESGGRRWLGLIALALIATQGLIGGLRVLVVSDPVVRDRVLDLTGGGFDVELRRAVKAMIHGVIAQVIFAGLCAILILTTRRWRVPQPVERGPLSGVSRGLALAAPILVVIQLALGTIVRQTGTGVMWHVLGAFVVTLTVLALLLRVMRHHGGQRVLRRLAWWIGILLTCQVFLGVTPWVLTGGVMESEHPFSAVAMLRSAHVVCGSLILALLAVNALWLFRLVQPGTGRGVSTATEFDREVHVRVQDYFILTKARLSALVMVTVAAGYFIAAPEAPHLITLLATMIGVAMVAGGTGAMNQYLERDRDALMDRTRDRPLPAGRMTPLHALNFGLAAILIGVGIVAAGVNLLAAGLTALTSAIYLGVYTPLKTRTTLNTLVGAIPGALPPMIGWAAATGEVGQRAMVLFAILYVWQLPHFWAIAWMYRGDYAKGGMKMLSVYDESGGMLARQIVLWCGALILTSMLPVFVDKMASPTYGIAALVLGLGFLGFGVVHAARRTRATTRAVFFASLVYLPALLIALLIDVWR